MSTERILIHGTTAQRMATTPALGQIGSDDETGRVVLGDGSTPGGIQMARLDEIGGGSAEEISYDNETSGLVADNVQAAIDEAVAKAMRLPIGMTLSNSVSLPNTAINISAGRRRSLDDIADIVLPSTTSKRLDAVWAAGAGNGGLDTGVKANSTWYHVFAIRNPTTGATDALFSTSPTVPLMPSGFTQKVRRGAIMTDGSGNIRAFTQSGNEFLWPQMSLDVNATNPGTSAQAATLLVPSGVQVWAKLSAMVQSTTAQRVALLITSLAQSDTTPAAASNSTLVTGIAGAAGTSQAPLEIRTNTSGQIRYRVDVSVASTQVFIATVGWIDPLS